MLAGKVADLLDFRFRHVPGEHPAHPDTPGVDMQHDLGGLFLVHAEKDFQHEDDEFHGGEIIVQQKNLEHGRPFQLRPGFLYSNLVIEPVIRVFRHLRLCLFDLISFNGYQYSTGRIACVKRLWQCRASNFP